MLDQLGPDSPFPGRVAGGLWKTTLTPLSPHAKGQKDHCKNPNSAHGRRPELGQAAASPAATV